MTRCVAARDDGEPCLGMTEDSRGSRRSTVGSGKETQGSRCRRCSKRHGVDLVRRGARSGEGRTNQLAMPEEAERLTMRATWIRHPRLEAFENLVPTFVNGTDHRPNPPARSHTSLMHKVRNRCSRWRKSTPRKASRSCDRPF
eukprot:scaffold1954_cov268-Pinguiococcus_pyrenoidosus.AAC.288